MVQGTQRKYTTETTTTTPLGPLPRRRRLRRPRRQRRRPRRQQQRPRPKTQQASWIISFVLGTFEARNKDRLGPDHALCSKGFIIIKSILESHSACLHGNHYDDELMCVYVVVIRMVVVMVSPTGADLASSAKCRPSIVFVVGPHTHTKTNANNSHVSQAQFTIQ